MGQKLVTIKFEQGSSSIFWNQKYNPVFKIEISRDGGPWIDVSNLEYCSRLLNIQPSAPILPGDLVTEQLTNSKLRKIIQKGQSLAFFVDDDVDFWRISYKDDFLTLGEWEELAGTTGWETIITQLAAEFRYRVAGGSDNALLPKSNGRAVFKKVYGNTVKWNQLLASGRLVDMGLPSGTLWATSNIDITQEDGFAASPFQYGCTLFSWGNVEGHNTPASGTTFDYNWGGVNAQEPWYGGQPYGETTGAALITNIVTGDTQDAARFNLGSLFKMPSLTQFQELINNCIFINANGDEIPSTTTNKLVTVNGIVGLYLQSKTNGNRLFFACAGYGNGTSWDFRGSDGHYWSASFNSARYARSLVFYSGGVYPQNNYGRFLGFAVRAVVTPSTTSEVGHDNHKFCLTSNHKNMVDLTALEYPNIASTTPTVEEVEAWLALNVGTQDYYPYDKGSLVSFKGSALQVKKDGAVIDEVDLSGAYINVWDEEWEQGAYNATTGEKRVSNTLRNKNFIPVVSGKTYYFKAPTTLTVLYYDANYGYDGQKASLVDNTLTIPDGVAFINFFGNAPYWQSHLTYNHDICINVSNADINGTYYPHALQRAGNVTDEDTATELTKKIGIRAYRSGDESDPTVITDGTTTYYPLVTPIVIPHDTPMQYAVDKYSTEEVIVPASVAGEPTSTNIVADIEYQKLS